MLINCPKCGFTQPDDRYCARCGVDMKAYRPPELNWFERTIKKPSSMIFLSVIVLLVGYSYIQSRKQQQELENRAQLFRSAGPVIVKTSPSTSLAEAPPEPEPPIEVPTETMPMQASPRVAAEPVPAAELNNASTAVKKTIISVRYFEMDRSELDRLFDESARIGVITQFGGLRAGPIPNQFLNLGRERGTAQLHMERIELSPDQNQKKWFVGKERGNNNRIGLSQFLQMDNQPLDTGLRLELETVSHFRINAEDPKPTDRGWPLLQMVVDSDNSWLVQLELPRNVDQLPGTLLAELGILRIFRSLDFKSDKSEFTMIISSVTDKK